MVIIICICLKFLLVWNNLLSLGRAISILDKLLSKFLISAFELGIIIPIVVFAIFCSKINVSWWIDNKFVVDYKVGDLSIYEEVDLVVVFFSLTM